MGEPAERLLWLGMKSTGLGVGRSAGTYFHCLTASVAASTRIGFPPIGEIFPTEPFGLIEIDSRTTPPIAFCFNSRGYLGATL